MNWQNIETAPRDGVGFLAYQDGMMGVGSFWRSGSHEHFSIDHVSGYECEFELDKPTHWMPLPEPPSSS